MISASSKKNTVNDSRMEMDRLTWNKIRRVLKHLAGVYNFIILTLLNCNVQVLYKIIFSNKLGWKQVFSYNTIPAFLLSFNPVFANLT
jgi:hypothetical protein